MLKQKIRLCWTTFENDDLMVRVFRVITTNSVRFHHQQKSRPKPFKGVHLPALSVHASHSQMLPSGVQEVHLLPDFRVFLLAQVPLPQQGSAGPEDPPHTALVGGQLYHVPLVRDSKKQLTHIFTTTPLLSPRCPLKRRGCLTLLLQLN